MVHGASTLLLTCEHATNRVPARFQPLFQHHRDVLSTHRAWDPGARELARHLARQLHAPLLLGRISRLLIEINRSLHHPHLWSEFSRTFSLPDRQELVARYYLPHRQSVLEQIRRLSREHRPVLHLGVHTFTPTLQGQVRQADIGLLYDPARPREKAFASQWQQALNRHAPRLRVRRNYPYLGKADGLVSWLREKFPPNTYIGIELEVNQAFPLGNRSDWKSLQHTLSSTLTNVLV